MIRISLPYVWLLSEQLEALTRLPLDSEKIPRLDLIVHLFTPQSALEGLLNGSVFTPTLRSSRPSAVKLLELLNEQVSNEDYSEELTRYHVWAIKNAYEEFKIAFLAELGMFPNYFVSQKGSFDTLSLLELPLLMFPTDLIEKVPEAKYDVEQAGKAICFEVHTACGFHLGSEYHGVCERDPPEKVRKRENSIGN